MTAEKRNRRDLNLQNITTKTELGRKIRRAFAQPPGATLNEVDYSAIELRILATQYEDPPHFDGFDLQRAMRKTK